MSAQLTVIPPAELGFAPNEEQRDLLKRTICVGATDDEFHLFLAVCKRTGLDPFARQIFAIKRWNKDQGREVMSTQTSIDGFRLIAERTKSYRGQGPVEWCGGDGVWKDVWLGTEPPYAARATVFREGWQPMITIALFDSYAGKTKDGNLTMMWQKMPEVMIAKCAEALALRKAFPQELSGLYTSDEMDQAQSEPVKHPHLNPENPRPVDPEPDNSVISKGKKLVGVEKFPAKDGQPKDFYGITCDGGSKCGTFDETLGTRAEFLKASGAPCDLTVRPGKKQGTWDLLDITESKDDLP